MVNLDIDMDLLTKYAYLIQNQGVSASKGAQGSQNAQETENDGTKFYQAKGYNAKQLVQDLDLKDPKNRYAIIKMMKQSDLMSLLPLLEKKALLQGMKFFTKDKLSVLLSYLPEEQLAQVLQNMYSPKEMMELMPTKVIRKFLTNQKIERKHMLKYMDEQMKPEELKDMYKQATGKDIDTNNKEEMVAKIGNLKPILFNEAISSMSQKHTKGMATAVLEEQPDLLKEFSSLQMSHVLDKSTKSEIIEGMDVLDEDVLSKLVDNLPPQLIQQVVTQIDPEVFADKLLTDMTQILDKLG